MIPDHTHNRKKRRKNPHKPRHDLKGFIKFTAIAVVIMVGFEYVAFGGGERPYITKIKHDYYARKQAEYIATQQALEDALPPEVTFSAEELSRLEADNTVEPSLFSEKYLNITKLDVKEYPSHEVKKRPSVTPLTVSPVLTMSEVQKKSVYKNITKPKIAIVIDDVGMNIKQSHAAIDLPIKATLAMLPYAKQVRNMAHKAKQRGHELIIHTPMEAMNGNNASLGTMALRSDMAPAAFKAEFNKMANSFDGYVGVNNHMGSLLTQDNEAMTMLMGELSKRGLFFLDSKTINTSVAAKTAAQHNIAHASRDVFLDHEDTPEFVAQALLRAENIARQTGSVIAIGHPKANTMNALKTWIPQAKARGFEFVAVSRLMTQPAPRHHRVKKAQVQKVGNKENKEKVIVVNVEPTTPKPRKVALPLISYPVD